MEYETAFGETDTEKQIDCKKKNVATQSLAKETSESRAKGSTKFTSKRATFRYKASSGSNSNRVCPFLGPIITIDSARHVAAPRQSLDLLENHVNFSVHPQQILRTHTLGHIKP